MANTPKMKDPTEAALSAIQEALNIRDDEPAEPQAQASARPEGMADLFAGETVLNVEQLYPLLRRGPDAPPEDVYITLCFQPVRGESGEVAGVFITLFDVTADVHARAAAQERERLFAAAEASRAEAERANRAAGKEVVRAERRHRVAGEPEHAPTMPAPASPATKSTVGILRRIYGMYPESTPPPTRDRHRYRTIFT